MKYKTVAYNLEGLLKSSASTEKLDNIFNELASDGWEYVDSRQIESNEFTTSILFIFKKS